mgnify:CR=1 FL=1
MLHEKQVKLQIDASIKTEEPFLLFENIIVDRGSRYSVSVGKISNRSDVALFIQQLKSKKKYAKATHNTWACRAMKDGCIFESKNDDGETGAGMVVLRQMQKVEAIDMVICVTRWFGGVYLQGDRFKHVKDATNYALEKIALSIKEK